MEEIIIRSLQGRATPEEEAVLSNWRQASLENERFYRDTSRVWSLAALLEPQSVSGSRPTLTAGRRGHSERALLPVFARYRAAAIGLAAAACLVVGIGIGLLAHASEPSRLAAEEFVTGHREMVTIRLSDGTVVRLAPDSRLRVGDNGRERSVWLDGHGFFAVATDSSRGFVVRTRVGDAVALGTRFDVQVEDNDMQVFVVEGRVAHQTGTARVEVGTMQISRVTDGGTPKIEQVANAGPLLSWMGEFLVFQATPIKEVAVELERRYGVEVRVTDAGIAARTVTAWFADESLDDVLLIVCRAADVHCSVRNNVVIMEP